MRAPVAIHEKDDGTWKEGKPIALFNGKDLTGWKGLVPGAEVKWTVKDGVLRNDPPTTDIISERSFWNYKLHTDFRIVEHSNSGIGLRGRYEIQILSDYGIPPNAHSAGALYSRIAPSVNASKPTGEWQTYDIRLVGMQLTVVHNDVKVLDKVEIEGLTAIADNADEGEPRPVHYTGRSQLRRDQKLCGHAPHALEANSRTMDHRFSWSVGRLCRLLLPPARRASRSHHDLFRVRDQP